MRSRLPAPLLATALALSFLSLAATAHGQAKLLGAEEILRRTAVPSAQAKKISPEEFQRRIMDFVGTRSALAPQAHVQRWYELYRLSRNVESMVVPMGNELIALLPDPNAWSELARLLREGAKGKEIVDQADRLLAAVLIDDLPQQYALTDAILASKSSASGWLPTESLKTVRLAAAQRLGDSAKIAKASLEGYRGLDSFYHSIPDLVQIHGKEKATPLLRKELLSAPKEVIIAGAATRALAKQIVRQEMARLKGPKWHMVSSLEDADLYDAMAKRFPKASPEFRGSADLHAFFGFLARGDKKRALAIAKRGIALSGMEFGPDLTALRRQGKIGLLETTLYEIVNRQPRSGYFDLALAVGLNGPESAKLITRLKAVYAAEKNPQVKPQLHERLKKALLATDRIEEAASLERNNPQMANALFLARLGRVTNRPAWIAQAVDKALKPRSSQEDFPGGRYESTSLLPILIEAKDWGRAERILLSSLKAPTPLHFSQTPNGDLVNLAGIYHRAGRPADVRRLLDEAATWGTDDVAGLLTMFDAKYLSFGAIAGSALVATGERERGIAVLRATLRLQPVDDAAARALVDAEVDTAIPLLTALAKVDPFEERPLIWIAYAHLKAGRLNEAETTIRKAISIDPSDGEQPHGHRMAAYGVLADILKAQGKADEERTMRGVVAAVRLAEQADDEAEVGLYSRSTKTYRRSLTLFSDAYCIQSRLAVQLADQGRFEEAETHYRRAYELMPDSFGRVESHCFGCEGAFTGERVQRIAENVFMRLVREQPTKPQVHYLLGYLRSAQENPSAALPHYRQAVILDPDYLNAWKSLREIASLTPGAEADLKRADAALARLDPLNRHTQAAPSSLRDRYNRGVAALRSLPSLPDHLYPLPKSSRPADGDSPFGMGAMGFAPRGYYASLDLPRDPSELLAKDQILVAVMGFNSMLGMARP